MECVRARDVSFPLVTVITIAKDGAATIAKAIDSVCNQDYPNIEFIVKYGISTDDTWDVIEKNKLKIDIVLSKVDSGISDAWNQAIECASGDFIALLNCDDEWSSDFISAAVDEIVATNSDLVFGDTVLISKRSRRTQSGSWSSLRLWRGIGFLHPTVVAPAASYKNIDGFRTDLKYAMDADWIVRLYLNGGKFSKHQGIAFMSTDGLSNRNWKYARAEYLKVLRSNRLSNFIYVLAQIWFAILLIKKGFLNLAQNSQAKS
jgi:glycosyltransferase involved in cell wall biosynthesis